MPFNGKTLKPSEKSYLIKVIKDGNTKTRCIELLMSKFNRSISDRNVSRFARINKISFKPYVDPKSWTKKETDTLRGLCLVGSAMVRILAEIPNRGHKSMMRKIKSMRWGKKVGEDTKAVIAKDIKNGRTAKQIGKKHSLPLKYVSEFKEQIKDSTVEIDNLKRWEEMDVNAILDHIEEGQRKLRNIDSEQGNADITITTASKFIAITFMSDFHLENMSTDVTQLRKDFNIIKNTKDFYMGFGGDLADNAISGPHPDGIVEAVVPPKAARLAAGRLFDELKNKVLYLILGCHDNWDLANDYNLVEHISRKLKVPYLGHGGDINLTIKNHSNKNSIVYSIHARHKYRGSSGLSNGTACCKNVLRDIDSKYDVVSIGHNHFAEIKLEHYLGKLRVFVRNGSYKREDRYSKMLGFKSNEFNIQIPVVIFNTKTKEMKVVSGIESAAETLRALNR